MSTNDPEGSKISYPVTAVAGHNPAGLDDFVGATTVTVENDGKPRELLGAGIKDGQTVSFYPRDGGSADEDVPVWTITEHEAGAIVAEPSSDD